MSEKKIEELYARKQKADAMPAARERFRAEYDAICGELCALLSERGQLPIELLNIRDDLKITVEAIGQLSHAILSGTAGPEQCEDWARLWRSLVEFDPLPDGAQEVFPC